jgi:hypothetical protein
MRSIRFLLLLVFPFATALNRSAYSQGPLTPSGPPGPTMKTLDQIEPRIAVTNLPYTISVSGSYYLTTNLSCAACTNVSGTGIIILASGVTLDLMGFELVGPGVGLANGIGAGSVADISIQNGTVRNWGNDGVSCSVALGGQYQHLRLISNGSRGINSGPASVVSDCIAIGNGIVTGSYGIDLGRDSIAKDCVAISNNITGFRADIGATVRGCSARGNSTGFEVRNGAVITGCTAIENGQDGIRATDRCRVIGNLCIGNGFAGTGINILGYGSVVDGNTVISNNINAVGLRGGIVCIGGSHNLIIRNQASGNGLADYNLTGTNAVGDIITVVSPSGVPITSANPWANFIY